MRTPSGHVTVGRLMVAVALVSLNLAAGLETFRYYPRPRPPERTMDLAVTGEGYFGDYVKYEKHYEDGHWEGGFAHKKTGRRHRIWVRRESPRPTTLRIWSPVLFSASVTLLAIAFLVPVSVAPGGAGRSARTRTALRTVCAASALLCLNLAASALADETYSRRLLSRPAYYFGPGTYVRYLDENGIEEGLDPKGEHPRNLRQPHRPSLWEVGMPVVGSGAISLLVIGAPYVRALRAQRPPPEPG